MAKDGDDQIFISPHTDLWLAIFFFTDYSQGYTFLFFLWWWFFFLQPSHLESNRGPLSKKLISLNIILSASGSRRALTMVSLSLSLSLLVTILRRTVFPYLSLGHPPLPPTLLLFSLFPFWRFNFLMRECFQRAREKYSVYER